MESKNLQEGYRLSNDVGWPSTFHATDTRGKGASDQGDPASSASDQGDPASTPFCCVQE